MIKGIKIGMVYDSAKSLLSGNIIKEECMKELSWFTATLDEKVYGMFPIVQVTAKNGKVMEILLFPNWEKYGKKKEREETEIIFKECIKEIESIFGKPYKDKTDKKAWVIDADAAVDMKIKIEKPCDLNIKIA